MNAYQLIISINDRNFTYYAMARDYKEAMTRALEELRIEIGEDVEIKIKITRRIKE